MMHQPRINSVMILEGKNVKVMSETSNFLESSNGCTATEEVNKYKLYNSILFLAGF